MTTTLAEQLTLGQDKYDPNTVAGCMNRIRRMLADKSVDTSMANKYSLDPEADLIAWKFWKLQEAAFWPAGELDYTRDCEDYEDASPEVVRALDTINGFFWPGDGILVVNLGFCFALESESMAETGALLTQMKQEFVHAEVYFSAITNINSDPIKREKLFHMVDELPCVKAKALWMEHYMFADIPKPYRIIAFACAEGIFFWASFCVIFWFRSHGQFVNFVSANVQIAKDESMHRDYACARYRALPASSKPPYEHVIAIIREAVEIEDRFAEAILPEPVEDLNAGVVKRFARFMANNMLIGMGYEAAWPDHESEYPHWMANAASSTKANFYEVNVDAYKQFSIKNVLNPVTKTKEEVEADQSNSDVDEVYF